MMSYKLANAQIAIGLFYSIHIISNIVSHNHADYLVVSFFLPAATVYAAPPLRGPEHRYQPQVYLSITCRVQKAAF